MKYPLEYRQIACLRCGKPIVEHKRWTMQDIEAVKGATYEHPINGYYSPVSPSVVGQWIGHDPMPWTEASPETLNHIR